MTRVRTFLNLLPEIGLLAIVVFYWFDTGLTNPIAAGLFLLVSQQMIFRRKVMGYIVGSTFIFLSLWMILAWLSDLAKITIWDKQAVRFFNFGLIFCGILLTSAVFTIVKYSRNNNQSHNTTGGN